MSLSKLFARYRTITGNPKCFLALRIRIFITILVATLLSKFQTFANRLTTGSFAYWHTPLCDCLTRKVFFFPLQTSENSRKGRRRSRDRRNPVFDRPRSRRSKIRKGTAEEGRPRNDNTSFSRQENWVFHRT